MNYGGGYMAANEYGADGGNSQPNAAAGGAGGPSPPRRQRDNKTLTPVTIRQLLNARALPDDTFKIDDNDLSQVTFVAIIRAINAQSANVIYTVRPAALGLRWQHARAQQAHAWHGVDLLCSAHVPV